MRPIIPNLWINDGRIEEAVDFWVGLFDDSRVLSSLDYGPEAGEHAGEKMVVTFELLGSTFVAINGADTRFEASEAVSLAVPCDTQEEIDRVWAALTDGGTAGPCGWLSDRYGFSWQVYPAALDAYMSDPDPARVQRVVAYFMTLDGVAFSVEDLQAAYEGRAATH